MLKWKITTQNSYVLSNPVQTYANYITQRHQNQCNWAAARPASTQKQPVLTTKRIATPFVSLQLSLSRKHMRFLGEKKNHSVHLETNLPSTMFICSASSCLSRLHSASCAAVCDAPLLVFKWCLKARSFAFIQRGESLHYPCRLFELCCRGLVPVYVFLPCAACIPEHSLKNPAISCKRETVFMMRVQKKGLKRLPNS